MRRSAISCSCCVQFIVVLDVTIVAVALPAIRADLGFSGASLQWVLTAYTLTFGGLLVVAGHVGDLVGRRRVLRIGLALFGAASLGCGLAWSAGALVGLRALRASAPRCSPRPRSRCSPPPARGRRAPPCGRLVDRRGRRWRRRGLGARRRAGRDARLAHRVPGQRAGLRGRDRARPAGARRSRSSARPGSTCRLDRRDGRAGGLVNGLTRAEAAGFGDALAIGSLVLAAVALAAFAAIEATAPRTRSCRRRRWRGPASRPRPARRWP